MCVFFGACCFLCIRVLRWLISGVGACCALDSVESCDVCDTEQGVVSLERCCVVYRYEGVYISLSFSLPGCGRHHHPQPNNSFVTCVCSITWIAVFFSLPPCYAEALWRDFSRTHVRMLLLEQPINSHSQFSTISVLMVVERGEASKDFQPSTYIIK